MNIITCDYCGDKVSMYTKIHIKAEHMNGMKVEPYESEDWDLAVDLCQACIRRFHLSKREHATMEIILNALKKVFMKVFKK